MNATAPGEARACDACLARSWLLGRLAGHLDTGRAHVQELLALADAELLAAVGAGEAAQIASEREAFDAHLARRRAGREGLEVVCRCDGGYPPALLDLEAPPAVLHVAGGLERLCAVVTGDVVAVVGSRRASAYGLEVARELGRSLVASGVSVASGMANGIDTAAHTGALSAASQGGCAGSESPPGATLAVLPGCAARPYPAGQRPLYRRIRAAGTVLSELPPGTGVRRWMFPARNRIIAALACMTVVVEAGARSGALITSAVAARLGRPVGAVPGRITSTRAQGANHLLANGAHVICGAQDVLDAVYGSGMRAVSPPPRQPPAGALMPLLSALADGCDTTAALARAGLDAREGLAALAALELDGHVRRGPGGAYVVCP
jgi:DNA processing protein